MAAASEFGQCCAIQRWFVDMGWITRRIGIDNLQLLAESAGVVDELGHDEVQRRIAHAFAPTWRLPVSFLSMRAIIKQLPSVVEST